MVHELFLGGYLTHCPKSEYVKYQLNYFLLSKLNNNEFTIIPFDM